MKTILVTGGAGFIGSNFIKIMLKTHPHYKIINVDVLTYAGNLENLKDIADNSNYTFIKADIRDRAKIDETFASYDIDTVVNFAAEERQEALYFLQGESPGWVRSSQPPIPRVAAQWVTLR